MRGATVIAAVGFILCGPHLGRAEERAPGKEPQATLYGTPGTTVTFLQCREPAKKKARGRKGSLDPSELCSPVAVPPLKECNTVFGFNQSTSRLCVAAGAACPAALAGAATGSAEEACRATCQRHECTGEFDGQFCSGSYREIKNLPVEEADNNICRRLNPDLPKLCLVISVGTCECGCAA